MTTIRQIIIDAYRESGLVQVGTTPEADEFDEGLRKIQTMISALFGQELGEPLTTYSYGTTSGANSYATIKDAHTYLTNKYIPMNSRLIVTSSSPDTVYFPPVPRDGARIAVLDLEGNFATNNFTINGNGRKVEGANILTLDTDSASKEWFYRDDLGSWVLISDLTANSESPFPKEFDDFLTTMLAIRMNPRYQVQAAPETVQAYRKGRTQFISRYSQHRQAPAEVALLSRSNLGYWADNEFDVGYLYLLDR